MDITFKCPNCEQELEVDATAAGSDIECPACSKTITVPLLEPAAATPGGITPPKPPTPPAKEEKHFSVPVHEHVQEALIQKAKAKPLAVVAKEGGMRIRTFKHSQCHDAGKDNFDDIVSEALETIGQANVVHVVPVSYSYTETGSRQIVQDYGLIIVFKG
jgi:DNA-directed RNA polymerase subunit RPC12/RpoP